MIEPEPLQQVSRTFVRLGKRKLSYFSGCDYFRLSSHPKVLAALKPEEAGEWIEAHRRAWQRRLDRFESFVERTT